MKSKFTKLSLAFGTAASLAAINADACTTVFWNQNNQANVVARSTDLYTSDQPRIMVFPRGIERNGEAGDNSLTWKSKYGSVVVTAFQTNAVSDGLNEQGLAAHLLYLSKTEYPKPEPGKPALSNLLWSQYVLDNFKTVDEAVKATEKLQIVSMKASDREWPLHLALEDATGDSAIIEFLNGKMKIYHSPQYKVMTNEPAYNVQLENLKRYQGFGGKLPLPGDPDPLSRFVRASAYLKTLPQPTSTLEAIAGVLSVIRTVTVPFGAVDTSGNKTEDAWATRWVSIADVTNKIYYFNSTTAPNVVWIDFSNLNFAEDAPVLSLDPTDVNLIGEISKNLTKAS